MGLVSRIFSASALIHFDSIFVHVRMQSACCTSAARALWSQTGAQDIAQITVGMGAQPCFLGRCRRRLVAHPGCFWTKVQVQGPDELAVVPGSAYSMPLCRHAQQQKEFMHIGVDPDVGILVQLGQVAMCHAVMQHPQVVEPQKGEVDLLHRATFCECVGSLPVRTGCFLWPPDL